MKITADIDINLDGVLDELNERFGLESDAQKAYDEKVWAHMEKYVPYDTESFLEHNRNLNDPAQFGKGELIFESDPASGFDYQVWWLWNGKSKGRIISNYTNPLSTPQWSNNVVANEIPQIIDEMQTLVDNGEI